MTADSPSPYSALSPAMRDRPTRALIALAALLLLSACGPVPARCLRVPGEKPRTVYSRFTPYHGCLDYWRIPEPAPGTESESVSESVCGSFMVASGECPKVSE